MHAKASPILEAHHHLVAQGLRVIRETFPGRISTDKMSTEEFRHWVGEALGMASPPARSYWNHLETGYREISAGSFQALVAAVGMDMEEVLSLALHEMVHGEALLVRAHRDKGRQRLIGDVGRWDRIIEMAQQLVALDAATRPQDEESRSADATERPPSEST